MKYIISKKLFKPIGPYSHGTIVDNIFFSGGLTAIDPKTQKLKNQNVKEETRQVMKNLRILLEEIGLKFSNVIKVNIYLTKMSDYSKVNKIYEKYFSKNNFPARSCIEVSKLPGDAKIEIEFIAYYVSNGEIND